MVKRITCRVKRFFLKYVLQECISGVERGPGIFDKIDFYIDQIGPDNDDIAVLIPRCFAPFTQTELWAHEFVEHSVGNILWNSYERVQFGSMPVPLPFKHFITCLSTYSGADNGTDCWHITPDEYIRIVELDEFKVN